MCSGVCRSVYSGVCICAEILTSLTMVRADSERLRQTRRNLERQRASEKLGELGETRRDSDAPGVPAELEDADELEDAQDLDGAHLRLV